jgi:hypothetical protein
MNTKYAYEKDKVMVAGIYCGKKKGKTQKQDL